MADQIILAMFGAVALVAVLFVYVLVIECKEERKHQKQKTKKPPGK